MQAVPFSDDKGRDHELLIPDTRTVEHSRYAAPRRTPPRVRQMSQSVHNGKRPLPKQFQGRGLMFIFTPRQRIYKDNGYWWLDLGYGASKLPHDTWAQAARHAVFIHHIRTEV